MSRAATSSAAVDTRLNIILSEKARTELEDIATKTRRSMTEVIRIALSILKVAFDEIDKGNKLAIVDAGGKPIKEIVLPS